MQGLGSRRPEVRYSPAAPPLLCKDETRVSHGLPFLDHKEPACAGGQAPGQLTGVLPASGSGVTITTVGDSTFYVLNVFFIWLFLNFFSA